MESDEVRWSQMAGSGQARIVSLWKLGERRYWFSPQREGD
jgi:hypothetical protein